LVWPVTSPEIRTTSPTWVKVMVPLTFDPLRGSSVAVAVGSFSSIMAQPEKTAAQQATANKCFFMIPLLGERLE